MALKWYYLSMPGTTQLTQKSLVSALLAHRLFDGERWHGPSLVHCANGLIAAIEPAPRALPDGALRLPEEAILAPGFIDLQVNGGGGVMLNDDPSLETIRRIVDAHRRYGTTGLLPTLITDAGDKLQKLAAVAQESLSIPGVLGFHLEGPLLNPARKGIHPQQHVRTLTDDDKRALMSFASAGRSFVTLAPEEIEVSLLHAFRSAGLRVAAGHSEATAVQIEKATDAGMSGVTHLFNAMSQMTPRQPGVVGATLGDDRLYAGIICDGFHVAPLNLKAAFKAKTRDRLMLVTDAMATAGSNIERFTLSGREITLVDGLLTGADGTLAGAHLTMIDAVRNAVTLMEVKLEDALVMASRTPAAFLGLDKTHGLIAPDARADLVAFTPDWRVIGTFVGAVGDVA